jgi:hypothetical protein
MSKERELLEKVIGLGMKWDDHSWAIPIELRDAIEAHLATAKPRKVFTKPTKDELEAYAKSIGFKMDGQAFLDYYDQKGWRVGSSPMKNWQAAVRVWKRTASNGIGQQQSLVAARKNYGY